MQVFEALKEILSKSIKLKFIAYAFLWLVLIIIVFAVIGFVFLLLIVPVLFLTASSIALGIALALILAAVAFIVLVFASMFLEGIFLNVSKDFLEGNSFSFGNGIEKSKPRFVTAALQQIIVGILICIFLLLIFAPLIINAVSFFASQETITRLAFAVASEDSELLMSEFGSVFEEFFEANLALFFIPLAIAGIVFIVLIPFLIVLKQVAFFESVTVLKSIKRAWNLGFSNFLKNWGFFILYFIVVMIVSTIVSAVLEFSESITALFVFFFIAFIAVQVWIAALSMLFQVQVYNLDVSGTGLAVQKKLPAVRKQTAISPIEEKKKEIASRRFASRKRTEAFANKALGKRS